MSWSKQAVISIWAKSTISNGLMKDEEPYVYTWTTRGVNVKSKLNFMRRGHIGNDVLSSRSSMRYSLEVRRGALVKAMTPIMGVSFMG